MYQALGLELEPPVPLTVIFEAEVLSRLDENYKVPKKEQRSPPPKTKKSEVTLDGLAASARAAALDDLRTPEPEPESDYAESSDTPKVLSKARVHAKPRVTRQIIPASVLRPKLDKARSQPASMGPRRKAVTDDLNGMIALVQALMVDVRSTLGMTKLKVDNANCANLADIEKQLPRLHREIAAKVALTHKKLCESIAES